MNVVVMIMPEGLDPAEFVAKHGADAVREAGARARPLVEYMVRRTVERHDLSTVEGRSAAVADALPLFERLSDPVRRSEYAGLLADLAGVAESSVLQSLERRLGGRPQEVAKAIKHGTAQERVEREMLKVLVSDADTFQEMIGSLTPERFRSSSNRRLFVASRMRRAMSRRSRVGRTRSSRPRSPPSRSSRSKVSPRSTTRDLAARLQEFELKAKSDQLRLQLQKLNPTTDAGYDQLFQELVEVDGELRRVRQRVHGAV